MPIYEFYCDRCHVIFQFFSQSVNTKKRPACPKCEKKKLERRMSGFAFGGRSKEEDEDLPFDESKMASAIESMASEADSINEDDPREAARFMRKFTEKTGMELGDSMNEAIARMEKGASPEEIEQDLGDSIENEEPFKMLKKAGRARADKNSPARRDPKIYDL